MILLRKENIETTEKGFKGVCEIWGEIGALITLVDKGNRLGFSIILSLAICKLPKIAIIKALNKIDYTIYYCNKKDFNYIGSKKYIEYKHVLKDIYILEEKYNKIKNKEKLDIILKDKSKFKKII
ncbi:hypothetical protein HYI19_18230 [Clostridium botulinum]|uniref:hypothetical protein n=1 Tax=Clostridium botulinum TaxID=1491 RepID=UPI001C9B8106|nr:hypothetical protein [Clostridium botulinum]MBY6846732.1 hypothetical protein [Clostridium botulinum]